MRITISDKAQVIAAIEAERNDLYLKASKLSADSRKVMSEMYATLEGISSQQRQILAKLISLDDILIKLIAETQ